MQQDFVNIKQRINLYKIEKKHYFLTHFSFIHHIVLIKIEDILCTAYRSKENPVTFNLKLIYFHFLKNCLVCYLMI